ncbi:MAG: hypothetical protein SW127_15575 [Actinomycetota bacterium]|nr:hypothetical protein [Actinomycetota bacterium]
MTPTYDQVTAWRPETMSSIAAAVRSLQEGVDAEAPLIGNPVLNLTTNQWKGVSRTAADGRAEKESRWLKNVGAKFGDLATSLEDWPPQIRGAMDALKGLKGDAADQGYMLRTSDPGYTVDFVEANAPDGAEFNQGLADSWSSRLRETAEYADTTVQQASATVANVLDSISALTPESIAQNSSTIDPSKAAGDAQAILSGTATGEQRARFQRATQLTPEQLAKLNRGESIDLSPERMKYLQLATGAVDVGNGELSGISAFDSFGTGQGDESLRAGLADGLQVISNENVHSPAGNGGFAMLPQTIKDSVSRPDLVTRMTNGVDLRGVKENSALGRLVQAGDSRYQAGSELDRSLTEVARKYSDAIAWDEQESPRATAGDSFFGSDSGLGAMPAVSAADRAGVEDILAGVGRDKIAVHEAFTGEHGQDFIHDLMTVEWKDDGAAAGAMFSPAAADATVANSADGYDTFRANLTGETMEEVAKFMASKDGYAELMDMPFQGSNGVSVGEANPELTRALAHSLSPYVQEMGGSDDPATLGFDTDGWADPGEEGPGRFEGSERVFSAIATDDEAGKTLLGRASAEVREAAAEYADDPNAGDSGSYLRRAGVLQGLIDQATDISSQEVADDAYERELRDWKMRGSAYDVGSEILKLGTNAMPGSGAVEPLTSSAAQSLKEALIGPAPTPENINPVQTDYTRLHFTIASQVDDLKSQMDDGFVSEYGDWFDDQGSLKSFDWIKSNYDVNKLDSGLEAIVRQLDTSKNSSVGDLRFAYDETRKRE